MNFWARYKRDLARERLSWMLGLATFGGLTFCLALVAVSVFALQMLGVMNIDLRAEAAVAMAAIVMISLIVVPVSRAIMQFLGD